MVLAASPTCCCPHAHSRVGSSCVMEQILPTSLPGSRSRAGAVGHYPTIRTWTWPTPAAVGCCQPTGLGTPTPPYCQPQSLPSPQTLPSDLFPASLHLRLQNAVWRRPRVFLFLHSPLALVFWIFHSLLVYPDAFDTTFNVMQGGGSWGSGPPRGQDTLCP